MASAFFRFKQFSVWHDRCAMKVGTDGVLLGAWCPLPIANNQSPIANSQSPYRLLDIGTGSGLIALMLAQRIEAIRENNPEMREVTIHAIDIDADAVAQATDNFALSPWRKWLFAHHSTLQQWETTGEGYDLIVSNPPYFQDSLKNPDNQRSMARHTDTLSYTDLITHATRLLHPHGVLALILPIEAEHEIRTLATRNNLQITHITYVFPKPNKPAKRLLIALSKQKQSEETQTNTFYIESECAPRSQEYQKLTEDFYL